MNTSQTVQGEEASVRTVITQWADAIRRKDAPAALSHLASGYLHFSLAPPLIDAGAGATDLDAWFQTWDSPLELELRDLTVAAGDTVAFSHSLNRLAGTKKQEGRQELWFRCTLGLRKVGGTWKIAHEHESVPFYMDGSMRAAVDLKP
ncbi:nuclear transport factor 2 family protein [Mesorhizobium sp. LHD-90]|uniref:nuclear transport factor 2 family protein n=1 Tax=Mesorhizobium sp. LHD-90 TaxID=3071414 RepID=UPI0027E053A6|nr:nuclear transport factor 2 family protein [Mesorhizobium sp. LHD-90]MDQ6436954.1 nuclear transport factor 2 family protein [Mesorhizobium sp. LHD-90]